MNGDALPDYDHVVRYVRPTAIDEGIVDGSGFELRAGHKGISVNWLEYFVGDKEAQLAEVRQLRRLHWKKSGCLAELSVGATKRHLSDQLPGISIVEDPLDADPQGGHAADPSHSLICGLPNDPPERVEALQDMIAECVIKTYPTTV